jgi:hypothetical protein
VAIALLLSEDNKVVRSEIRAAFPVGECRATSGGRTINITSKWIINAFSAFAKCGWLEKTEQYVTICARDKLLDFVKRETRWDCRLSPQLLSILHERMAEAMRSCTDPNRLRVLSVLDERLKNIQSRLDHPL